MLKNCPHLIRFDIDFFNDRSDQSNYSHFTTGESIGIQPPSLVAPAVFLTQQHLPKIKLQGNLMSEKFMKQCNQYKHH